MDLSLVLVDPDHGLVTAWRHAFAEAPRIEIVRGRFHEIEAYDCLVSPGNSFGLMDGGVDAAIIQHFGDGLEARVQAAIRDRYLGQQPVGTCLLVPTGNVDPPWLAHAPTMRVPMPVAETDHAYQALWAVLTSVRLHNQTAGASAIRRIVCPGLATGVGRMPAPEAARQMSLAYRHFLQAPLAATWPVATTLQSEVRAGGDWGALIARRTQPSQSDTESPH